VNRVAAAGAAPRPFRSVRLLIVILRFPPVKVVLLFSNEKISHNTDVVKS
jgi:hypothetical protein